MVMGHTHLSYIRQLGRGKTVINYGSVGRTKEVLQRAVYVLITLSSEDKGCHVNFESRKLVYDIQETVIGIRKSTIPDFYADFLKQGSPA